jgi:hypothetical protein
LAGETANQNNINISKKTAVHPRVGKVDFTLALGPFPLLGQEFNFL